MKFTIKRSKWLRGSRRSFLVREADGKQCCMGQVCEQIGVPASKMRGVKSVGSLVARAKGVYRKLKNAGLIQDRHNEEIWLNDAYQLNDKYGIADEKRETCLCRLAADNGHEFEFID